MCLSLWGTLRQEAAAMFMWGLHNGTATWQLHDSNCALYQAMLMEGVMDSLDVPNTCHLLYKSASVTSQTSGICDYVRRQNSSFVLCVVGFRWKMRAVCVRNQLTKLQMGAKWGFPAVSQLWPRSQRCAASMVNSPSFLWPLRNRKIWKLKSKFAKNNCLLSTGNSNG